MNRTRLVLSILIAPALLLAPLQAGAVPLGRTIEYTTSYSLVYPIVTPGAYPGRMTLHFLPGGEVIGLYREEYQGAEIQVAGGLNGTTLWLTFGGAAVTRRFQGTLNNNDTISGSLMQWNSIDTYRFTAVPVTT